MKNELKTVGVLHERNPSPYSRAMMRELETAAPRYSIDISFLPVSWASSNEGDDPRVVDNTLSTAESCDGLVLISGVFSHGVNGLWRLAQKWSPRPVVSVGYRLPSVRSLMVDNRGAVRAATSHLIEKHGRKNLLFIRGRKDSHEAEERYLGYRHALRDHGLLYEKARSLEGDFMKRVAARSLLKLDPSLEYDGVVAANDDMALAAMDDLLRRGKKVPKDVAIIGFDDVPVAKTAKVPLSTVAQPFPEMARLSLDSLKQQSEGLLDDSVQAVSGELVLRDSCCDRRAR